MSEGSCRDALLLVRAESGKVGARYIVKKLELACLEMQSYQKYIRKLAPIDLFGISDQVKEKVCLFV